MIDIKLAIAEGQAKAENTIQNRTEIHKTLAELNQQLQSEDICIEFGSFSVSDIMINVTFKIATKHDGNLYLKLLSKDNKKTTIGKWSQHPDGYPFTIEYLMERTDCWDKEALILRLTSIISSGQFWLKVKELKASNV